MSARALISLALAAALLAACGRDEPAAEPAVDDAARAAAEAEANFAATCAGLGMDGAVCACVRDRVAAVADVRGLAYIGAAYGPDPTLAAPFEAAMSQDERNDAAEAFLNGQFECVVAADPTTAPAGPANTPPSGDLAESPFEQAVAACLAEGRDEEPACRCRVQAAFDDLGEDGVRLAKADAQGDTGTMRDLANRRGGDWLDEGQDALQAARLRCS